MSSAEVKSYEKLFDIVKSTDGKLSGREAVQFLQKSKLDRRVLKKIWSVGSGGDVALSRETFVAVMRLIAFAQKGGDPSSLAVLPKLLPLATLEGVEIPQETPIEKYLRLRSEHFAGVFQYLLRQSNSTNMTLHGKVVAMFFRQSNLPNGVLRDVWNIAVQGKQVMFMDFQAFARGMDLVQRAQQGLSIKDLSVETPPGYPFFRGVPVSSELINSVQAVMKRSTVSVSKISSAALSNAILTPKKKDEKDASTEVESQNDEDWNEFSTSPTAAQKKNKSSMTKTLHQHTTLSQDEDENDWGEFSSSDAKASVTTTVAEPAATPSSKEKSIDNVKENSLQSTTLQEEVKETITPLNELQRVKKNEAEETQNKMSAFDLVTDEEESVTFTTTTKMTTNFVNKEIVLYLLKPEGSVRIISF